MQLTVKWSLLHMSVFNPCNSEQLYFYVISSAVPVSKSVKQEVDQTNIEPISRSTLSPVQYMLLVVRKDYHRMCMQPKGCTVYSKGVHLVLLPCFSPQVTVHLKSNVQGGLDILGVSGFHKDLIEYHCWRCYVFCIVHHYQVAKCWKGSCSLPVVNHLCDLVMIIFKSTPGTKHVPRR